MPNIADDPKFGDRLQQVFEMAHRLTSAAMVSHLPGDFDPDPDNKDRGLYMVQSLVLGLHTIAGAVDVVARLVNKGSVDHITEDHIHFVTALAALCLEPAPDGKSTALCFGPDKIGEALDYVHRATGRKIDSVIMEPMVEAGRKMQAEGASPLKAFLEARASAKPTH